METLNPTGFELRLDRLISVSMFAPNPEHSRAILVTIDKVPYVLFWINGRWENHTGHVITDFEAWVYLQS